MENKYQVDEYISVKEFAKKVGVHYNTIIRSIKKGRLNAFRVGAGKKGCFRIAISEINRIAFMDLEERIERIINNKY